ncbi:predicted protein, partial [Nematostella vectensis]
LAKRAMEHWSNKTCLKFIPRIHENAYIEIKNDRECQATVGYIGIPRQQVGLGNNKDRHCSFAEVVHEFGHVIGFFHEQARRDRDDYVKIIQKNIRGRDEKFIDSRGEAYDYDSIMHYGKFDGGNGGDTILPIQDNVKLIDKIRHRKGLSAGDIRQTNLMYKC